MSQIKRWNNVQVEYSREVYRHDDGVLYLSSDDARLPDSVQSLTLPDYGEIVIECKSSGYYDPGRLYGAPENCYPPEGEDEREFVSAYFLSEYISDNSGEIPLPTEVGEELFALWQSDIDAVELPELERMREYDD